MHVGSIGLSGRNVICCRGSIYSPRVPRLDGVPYSMPEGSEVRAAQDLAIPMFWAWEERVIVSQRVSLGPP